MKRVGTFLAFVLCTVSLSACSLGDDLTAALEDEQYGSEIVNIDSEEDSKNIQNEELEESDSDRDSSEVVEDNTENNSQEEESEVEKDTEDKSDLEDTSEILVNSASGTFYVTKTVNIRKGPSTDFDKIGSLKKGDTIEVTGITSDSKWYQIEYNGQKGFLSVSYVTDYDSFMELLAQEEASNSETKNEEKSEETPGNQQVADVPASNNGIKSELVALMNVERANNGVGAIAESAELNELAQIRAQEIYTSFSHTRPDGSSCFTVLSSVSYSYAGENIAAGQRSTTEVMTAWMNSSGHRANILNGSYGKVGIGYYTAPDGYGTYWVQLFTD